MPPFEMAQFYYEAGGRGRGDRRQLRRTEKNGMGSYRLPPSPLPAQSPPSQPDDSDTARAGRIVARPCAELEMGRRGKDSVGTWVGVGVGVGVAFGVALKHTALGVGVGSVVGLAVGYLLWRYRNR